MGLVQLLGDARRILVFTGAGISTGSGIRDFRGPKGVCQHGQMAEGGPENDAARDSRAQWSRMWVTTSEARSAAPNRATLLSGAAIRSRNGIRHPLRFIVGAATAVKLSTMTHAGVGSRAQADDENDDEVRDDDAKVDHGWSPGPSQPFSAASTFRSRYLRSKDFIRYGLPVFATPDARPLIVDSRRLCTARQGQE